MTVVPYSEYEVAYKREVAFNEQLVTLDTLIPVTACRWGALQVRASDKAVTSRLFETRPGFVMPRDGAWLEIDVFVGGAGVDTATGALVGTWLYDLLSGGYGGGDLTQVGGVAGAAATTTAMAAATGTRVRGALSKVGEAGDGRAEGQFVVWDNPNTNVLTAMLLAPNAGDKIRAGQTWYVKEGPLAATFRFLVGFRSDYNDGAQYIFTGGALEKVTWRTVQGELVGATLRFLCAYFMEPTGFSVPTGLTLQDTPATPVGGGSIVLGSLGSATRPAVGTDADMGAEIDFVVNTGLQFLQGHSRVKYSKTIGWVRTKSEEYAGRVTIRVPFDKARRTSFDLDGALTEEKWLLWTSANGDGTAEGEGKSVGLFCPRLYPINQRPIVEDFNGLTYSTLEYAMREGPDTTNALTRSFFRGAFA